VELPLSTNVFVLNIHIVNQITIRSNLLLLLTAFKKLLSKFVDSFLNISFNSHTDNVKT